MTCGSLQIQSRVMLLMQHQSHVSLPEISGTNPKSHSKTLTQPPMSHTVPALKALDRVKCLFLGNPTPVLFC